MSRERHARPPSPDVEGGIYPLPAGVCGTTLDPIRTDERIPELWPPSVRDSRRGEVLA